MKKYSLLIGSLALIVIVSLAELIAFLAGGNHKAGNVSWESVEGAFEEETEEGTRVYDSLEIIDPVMDYEEYAPELPVTTVEALRRNNLLVDLPAGSENSFAEYVDVKIEPALGYVKFNYELNGIPRSDDDKYYLFEMKTYETSHGDNYIASVSKRERGCFIFSYSTSRLYDKYVMAVKKNGQFVDISRGRYITNPEAVASYTYEYPTPASKKGLIVDVFKVNNGSLTDLGVKQAAYNIPLGYLMGPSTSGNYGTISFSYNGKTYSFNGQRVAEFDIALKALTNQGIVTTVVILNDKGPYSERIHPQAVGGSCPYYMFNAANEEGCQVLEAAAAFLAQRYSGTEHGQVVNWVIGNEINARAEWNYMNYTDVNTYADEYAKAYRIFYNGIKSVNANARVYMCIDQLWDRNLNETKAYDAKDFLDAFNANINVHGNIDYGIAHHPYPVPLTWPKFWDMPANYKAMNLVRNSVDTPYITVQNIHVLTDYISQSSFLNPKGDVRSVLLNEVGFGSDHGETLQAACFAYAYYIVAANQHVDGFIINKQTDHPAETSQGLAFGLDYMNGGHKYIYNVYKYIDTGQSYEYTEFAKSIIGITDWSQVITYH